MAAVALAMSGCKADSASKVSSGMDASTGAPATLQQQSSKPVAETITKPASNDGRPVLVCFGDSLTAGLGMDPGETYPDDLQADLDAIGYRYRVVNEGISGNTTKDGLARVERVIAMRPAVVVVEFGGNDGLRGVPITASRANLDRIVAALKASGTKVVLAGITLPPDYGADYIQQFNETYVVLAKKYNLRMIPFLLQDVYGVAGDMQRDGVHATVAGNQMVAKNVLTLVKPLLKK